MHLTVSLLYLSGGKDEQEGPAAVKRTLREHREAKGEITTSSLSMHTHAALHVPVFEYKGQRCRSVPPPGSHSGFRISGLLLEKQGKTLRTQQLEISQKPSEKRRRRGGNDK